MNDVITERDGDAVVITDTLENGYTLRSSFHSIFGSEEFAQGYLRHREEMKTLGLEATLQKWHDEEAKFRRRLGLRVQESY